MTGKMYNEQNLSESGRFLYEFVNNWENIYIIVCKGKCTSPHNNKFVSILTKSSIKSWLNKLFLALE